MGGLAGTPLYMSPGLIQSSHRTKSDDLWALGVMLHLLIKGQEPAFLRKRFKSVDYLLREVAGLARTGYSYTAVDHSAKEQLLAGLLVASTSRRISVTQAALLAQRWMAEAHAGATESAVPSARPQCWAQCEKAKCNWKKSSCMLDDKNTANCVGKEDVDAADELEERLLVIRIRKGYAGKLGFHTVQKTNVVRAVEPGGKADRAGLKTGDVIVQIQNRPWESLTQMQKLRIIQQAPIVTLGVKRR